MKIVIEIPDEMYLNAKTDTLCGADILVSAIKNGTPLPKGHGRIGDFDIAEEWLEDGYMLDDVPALLEADKEGAEEDDKSRI